MDIEFSGCGRWNENKARFRAQTHVLSSSWEVNWASQLNGTQKRTQGAATPSLRPLCHPALPPQATGRRKKGFFYIYTHIPTGFGCLQAATWSSKPSTILDSAHTFQRTPICPTSLPIYTRIREQESRSATQIQTRQWRDAQASHWVQQTQKSLCKAIEKPFTAASAPHCCIASLPQVLMLFIMYSCLTVAGLTCSLC